MFVVVFMHAEMASAAPRNKIAPMVQATLEGAGPPGIPAGWKAHLLQAAQAPWGSG
jgi:hypothetical protein